MNKPEANFANCGIDLHPYVVTMPEQLQMNIARPPEGASMPGVFYVRGALEQVLPGYIDHFKQAGYQTELRNNNNGTVSVLVYAKNQAPESL